MPTPNPDQPLLDELTAALGTRPARTERDSDGHITALTLSGVRHPHLPEVLAQFSRLEHLALGEVDYQHTQMGGVLIVREFAAGGPPPADAVPAGWAGLPRLSLATNHWSPGVAGVVAELAPQRLSLESVNYRGLEPVLDRVEEDQIPALDVARLLDEEVRQRILGFHWLAGLGLSFNGLTSLPPEIAQLTQLKELNLDGNRLRGLPPELARLTRLERFSVNENPDLRTPPPEIVAQGNAAIMEFLAELLRGYQTRYEAKLLIVGEGGTGKSSLLRALQGQPFDAHLSTTHGIAIERLTFTPANDSASGHDRKAADQMILNVWDFGGQQIYHTTHQFFMTKRSLYLLVWNARLEPEQGRLDHWLRNIQVLAPEAPVLLVATHIDERAEDFNYDRFAAAYPQLMGHVGVSNRTGEGVAELRQRVIYLASQLPLMEQMWPETWVAAEEALAARPEQYTDQESFLHSCTAAGVPAEIASDTLSDYLHDLGKILHYRDDDSLYDFVVLQPNWLTHAISRVLDDPGVRAEQGILRHSQFTRIWDTDERGQSYPRHLYPRFQRLMERFLISYQLEREHAYGPPTRSLVPLLLPHRPPPDLTPWEQVLPDQPEIRMVFRLLDFVPPGMMSWFIVLTHAYAQGIHWREGVRLVYGRHTGEQGEEKDERGEHQAQVVLNPSTRELWIRVKGPMPKNFFGILQHTVNDRIIRRYFEGLRYRREIPCNCHEQRGEKEPCTYFHDYERLADRMEKGVLTAECGDFYEQVSVPELLEGIHHTANDRFAEKLRTIEIQIDKKAEQLRTGQADIQEELARQRVEVSQGFEHLRREFVRQWNFQMQQLHSQSPNTFVILSGQRGALHPRTLLDREHRLHLICQHPPHPHVVSGHPGYRLHQSHEWWQEVAPWLAQLSGYLKYIPSVGGVAEAYDKAFHEQIKLSLKVFELAQKVIPDDLAAPDEKADLLEHQPARSRPQPVPTGRGRDVPSPQQATGSALRALHAFLQQADPKKEWAGLSRIVNNDGGILWLCPQHRALYNPL